MLTSRDIAKMLDHSLLRPEMDTGTVRGLRSPSSTKTATVCVKPSDLPIAREVLAGSPVKLSTVIGFPHGSNRTDVKVFESERAMDDGAVELDMVINIGRLIAGDTAFVEQDIRAVVEAAHRRGAIVKVILENAYLNDGQKRTACQIAERAGADFVKTSTGFAPGGATLDDVALMRSAVSANVQVKAAGGVRTLDAVLAYRAAGCTRCGATASAAIMDEAIRREQEGILHEIEG